MTTEHPPPEASRLKAMLDRNEVAQAVINLAAELALPSWYLGAGAVAQTVWNGLHGYHPAAGIKDYDLVYFDPGDLSADTERKVAEEVADRLSPLGTTADVKNQARLHLWYEQRFGRRIDPYRSAEEAIATWPTTASSVGVRSDGRNFIAYAPFGLADLFGMVVRPNKVLVTKGVYEEK